MSVYRLSVIVTLVLAVAFLVPESGNAQSDSNYQLGTRMTVDVPQRYCGRKLSNILQTVCTGVYNNMFKKNLQQEDSKQHERSRSPDSARHSNMFSEMEVSEYPVNYERPSLFMSGMGATQFINRYHGGRVRRERRGIYEECCLSGCTLNELSTYCGLPQ